MNDIQKMEMEFELERLMSELSGVKHARGTQALQVKQRQLEIKRLQDAMLVQIAKEEDLEGHIKEMQTKLSKE